MTEGARPSEQRIKAGDSVAHEFVITPEDMVLFRRLSADESLIHIDADYARQRGYRDVIVYGALMLAQLSHVVGQHIPGVLGVSVKWSITYRSALYVNEPARIVLDVMAVSAATGLVEGRYRIISGERLIAEGRTQSMIPVEMIDDSSAPD